MTTYLGKSCSFGLPRVSFVNCGQFMYLVISLFGFEGRMWDLIVSVPDHCLSFYFGESRHPCRTPAVVLNHSPVLPLNRTALWALSYRFSKDSLREIPAASAESLPCLHRLQEGLWHEALWSTMRKYNINASII